MIFLIQTVNNEIVHDFSFTLIESLKYHEWLRIDGFPNEKIVHTFSERSDIEGKRFVPVGTVEFVCGFFDYNFGVIPKPINVPESLFHLAGRKIFNGTEKDITYNIFFKSNDKIKGPSGIIDKAINKPIDQGNYQISSLADIVSEWRAFVFRGELVGLQNYSGDFASFPSVMSIMEMIECYEEQPVAYTLDVGIDSVTGKTFVIEVHDFFSCGLYGFSNHNIYPFMLSGWYNEFIRKIKDI